VPITINGETYYKTIEAARLAGISRSTLLRWLSSGIIQDRIHTDRRGWRIFSDTQIKYIREVASRIDQD